MFSKATPLMDLVEGEFKEDGVYCFKGRSYAIRDLPDYIAKGAGLVIELYLKLEEGRKNDNQRWKYDIGKVGSLCG